MIEPIRRSKEQLPMLQKNKAKAKQILLVLGILLLITCEENIPEGPPRVEVTEAVLGISMDRNDFPQPTNFGNRYEIPEFLLAEWNEITDHLIRFRVRVVNIFDETVDGLKWIDVQLKFWSENRPEIEGTFSYRNFANDTTLIVIHPAHTYYVYTADSLIWDQTYMDGRSIHETDVYHVFKVEPDSLFNAKTGEWQFFCDTTYTQWVDTVVVFSEPIEMKAQASVKIFKNYEAVESNVLDFTITYLSPSGFGKKYYCPYDSSGGGGR